MSGIQILCGSTCEAVLAVLVIGNLLSLSCRFPVVVAHVIAVSGAGSGHERYVAEFVPRSLG